MRLFFLPFLAGCIIYDHTKGEDWGHSGGGGYTPPDQTPTQEPDPDPPQDDDPVSFVFTPAEVTANTSFVGTIELATGRADLSQTTEVLAYYATVDEIIPDGAPLLYVALTVGEPGPVDLIVRLANGDAYLLEDAFVVVPAGDTSTGETDPLLDTGVH